MITAMAEISQYDDTITATGKRIGPNSNYAAVPLYNGKPAIPYGTIVTIYYKKTGKTVTVNIQDCGSYKPKKTYHWIDLPLGKWKLLTNGSAPSRIIAQISFGRSGKSSMNIKGKVLSSYMRDAGLFAPMTWDWAKLYKHYLLQNCTIVNVL